MIVTNKTELRKQCDEWNGSIEELKEIKEKLISAMVEAKGVGIAANQIGLPYRIFYVGDEEKGQLFVNPARVKLGSSYKADWEGCLSCPNTMVRVKRARTVELRYVTLVEDKFHIVTRKFKGFEARKVQHELDHINGFLIVDRGKAYTP